MPPVKGSDRSCGVRYLPCNAATPADPYWASANDVTLAVPEPASVGMLVAGLGLVGFAARHRAG